MKAILIDPEYTVIDRDASQRTYLRPTPLDAFLHGFGVLLDRIAAVLTGGGVLVLTEHASNRLERLTDAGAPTPEQHGWKAGADGPFRTYTKGTAVIHVARWQLLAESRCPLWEPGLAQPDFVGRLRAWHDLTGHPYRGTPGIAGTDILRPLLEGRPKTPNPRWFLSHVEPGWHECERPYSEQTWGHNPETLQNSGIWEHEYDKKDAYAAAMASVYVAREDLRRRGKIAFDRTMAGFWHVDIAPWPADHYLPNPAGYPRARYATGPRAVTTPTLILLQELADAGIHGGFEIREAFVAKGYQELKPMRLMTRDARRAVGQLLDDDADPGQPAALDRGLKEALQEALGLSTRKGGRVFRPDWWNATVATDRCNTWRKLHKAACDPQGRLVGPFPHRVKTDAVYYASTNPDPWEAAPPRLDVRRPGQTEAGKFKVDVEDGRPAKTREVNW